LNLDGCPPITELRKVVFKNCCDDIPSKNAHNNSGMKHCEPSRGTFRRTEFIYPNRPMNNHKSLCEAKHKSDEVEVKYIGSQYKAVAGNGV